MDKARHSDAGFVLILFKEHPLQAFGLIKGILRPIGRALTEKENNSVGFGRPSSDALYSYCPTVDNHKASWRPPNWGRAAQFRLRAEASF